MNSPKKAQLSKAVLNVSTYKPHPSNELYRYQIKKVLEFLSEIGEL